MSIFLITNEYGEQRQFLAILINYGIMLQILVSWIASFISLFKSEKCQKIASYDGKQFVFKGLNLGIPNIPIEVAEIQGKYEKIRDASETALH